MDGIHDEQSSIPGALRGDADTLSVRGDSGSSFDAHDGVTVIVDREDTSASLNSTVMNEYLNGLEMNLRHRLR